MTKRRIQPKIGYFLIWKEFVLVDFRQWIRQHVQFCKKIHSVFIKFLWSWTEDQFRDDIFWFYWKECQKVILKWFPFIDKPGRKSLWKGNYDHLRNFDFIGPGVVSCLVKKKKKKRSKFTETGQANCNAIMQTTSFGFMNKERVSVWQFLCWSHDRKCVDKRRRIFVFYSFEIVWMFDQKIDWTDHPASLYLKKARWKQLKNVSKNFCMKMKSSQKWKSKKKKILQYLV